MLSFPYWTCFMFHTGQASIPVLDIRFYVHSHVTISFVLIIYFMTLRVLDTLTKTFPNGTLSTWKFGQLTDGRYAAKSNKGKRMIIGTRAQYDRAIRSFTYKYGYTDDMTRLIKQVSPV